MTKNKNYQKKNYKKAYLILMEYWDYLPDEDKPLVSQWLKECGL